MCSPHTENTRMTPAVGLYVLFGLFMIRKLFPVSPPASFHYRL